MVNVCDGEEWKDASHVWFAFVDEFEGCRYVVVEFDREIVGDFNSAAQGEEPVGRREQGRADPRASHTDNGTPITFDQAILVLVTWRSGFNCGF